MISLRPASIATGKPPAIDFSLPCIANGSTISGTRGCAVTQSPTRYVRAVLRSLCAPAASGAASELVDGVGQPIIALAAVPSTNLDDGVDPLTAPNAGPYFDINGARPTLPNSDLTRFQGGNGHPLDPGFVGPGDGSCLQSAQFANGLFTGQYMAPVFEYIFPENVMAGFAVVPNNFWHLGFLVYGENGSDGNSTAAQVPRPW